MALPELVFELVEMLTPSGAAEAVNDCARTAIMNASAKANTRFDMDVSPYDYICKTESRVLSAHDNLRRIMRINGLPKLRHDYDIETRD
jgi:hypothetical protein